MDWCPTHRGKAGYCSHVNHSNEEKEVEVMTEDQMREFVIHVLMNSLASSKLTGYIIKSVADTAVELAKQKGYVQEDKKDARCPITYEDLRCELEPSHDGDCAFV